MQTHVATAGVLVTLFVGSACYAPAQSVSTQRSAAQNSTQSAARDGRQDFDWDVGTWKTHQKRLLHPLTGSTAWVEYQGTDVVRKIWDGANEGLVEAQGPGGSLKILYLACVQP